MATTPDTDLATWIAADATLGLTLGTNLFTGPTRSQGDGIPKVAAFVLAYGGNPTLPFLDGSAEEWCVSTVQVTLRSSKDDFAGGLDLARAVRNRVHRHPPAGYAEVRVVTPEPLYLGQDESGAHLHALNVEMTHRRSFA